MNRRKPQLYKNKLNRKTNFLRKHEPRKTKKVEMPINKVKVRKTKVPVLPITGIKKLFKVEPVKPPDNVRIIKIKRYSMILKARNRNNQRIKPNKYFLESF